MKHAQVTLAALLLGAQALAQSMAPQPESANATKPFHPPGMWIWDNWFVHDGLHWHAFYLQLPKAVGLQRRWKDNDFYKHVGHATSANLRHWQDQGPALCALSGTWNDRHIATGSITRYEGRWWMVFTGRGTAIDGVGLAVSDDLSHWQAAQDAPLFPLAGTWGGEVDNGVFTSDWQGAAQRWVGISDPYLLPEAMDGWYGMVLCARMIDVPLARSGCLTFLRSRDLRQWQDPVILAWPGCFERMETPQLWKRGGNWYLSFGGVLNTDWAARNPDSMPSAVRNQRSHQNYCYTMDSHLGPAAEKRLHHVAAPPGHYIMKVLAVAPGEDVALFTAFDRNDSAISLPYPVKYEVDGSLKVVTTTTPGG